MKNIFAFIFVVFAANQNISAQTFKAAMDSAATAQQLVGVSAIAICGNEIQQIYHFGKSDIARNKPVTDSTLYRIASISKSITAIALMKLYERGLFGLDDDISTTLGYSVRSPSFPTVPITFRKLLSHTSGLQDGTGYDNFLSNTYANPTNPPSLKEILLPNGQFYTSDMWRAESPGTFFIYSNLNFGIVGTLVEKLSGRRFDLFVKDSILAPLQIIGGFNVRSLPNINNLSVLYRSGTPQTDNFQGVAPAPLDYTNYPIGKNAVAFGPQGGFRVSALGLTKILQMLMGNGTYQNNVTILQPATVALMRSDQWTFNGQNGDNYGNFFNSWGLGIERVLGTVGADVIVPNKIFYGHAGDAYGLLSDMFYDPIKKSGIVFITNGYTGAAGYTNGSSSTFFVPEEAAFKAYTQYLYNTCAASGVAESDKKIPLSSLKISPNPFTDTSIISWENLQSPVSLRLTDEHGKIVWTQNITENSNCAFSRPAISAGIYFLAAKDAVGKVAAAKMILK